MKKLIPNILAATLLWFSGCYIASAQDSGLAQADQITGDDQQIIQEDDGSSGTFTPVTVDAFTTSDVALQFPPSLTNKSVAIEAPDGGTLSSNLGTIDGNGVLGFSFQVSDQPGVHRVLVIDPNADEDSVHIVGIVQFEVPSQDD